MPGVTGRGRRRTPPGRSSIPTADRSRVPVVASHAARESPLYSLGPGLGPGRLHGADRVRARPESPGLGRGGAALRRAPPQSHCDRRHARRHAPRIPNVPAPCDAARRGDAVFAPSSAHRRVPRHGSRSRRSAADRAEARLRSAAARSDPPPRSSLHLRLPERTRHRHRGAGTGRLCTTLADALEDGRRSARRPLRGGRLFLSRLPGSAQSIRRARRLAAVQRLDRTAHPGVAVDL